MVTVSVESLIANTPPYSAIDPPQSGAVTLLLITVRSALSALITPPCVSSALADSVRTFLKVTPSRSRLP